MERLVLLRGRNYIETLVLNLTLFEIQQGVPSPHILKRLEDEICALSLIDDVIGETYIDMLTRRLQKLLPEGIQIPFKDPCNASEELWKWINKNLRLLKRHLEMDLQPDDIALKRLEGMRLSIVRSAILATLHKCGLLTLYPIAPRRR